MLLYYIPTFWENFHTEFFNESLLIKSQVFFEENFKNPI